MQSFFDSVKRHVVSPKVADTSRSRIRNIEFLDPRTEWFKEAVDVDKLNT